MPANKISGKTCLFVMALVCFQSSQCVENSQEPEEFEELLEISFGAGADSVMTLFALMDSLGASTDSSVLMSAFLNLDKIHDSTISNILTTINKMEDGYIDLIWWRGLSLVPMRTLPGQSIKSRYILGTTLRPKKDSRIHGYFEHYLSYKDVDFKDQFFKRWSSIGTPFSSSYHLIRAEIDQFDPHDEADQFFLGIGVLTLVHNSSFFYPDTFADELAHNLNRTVDYLRANGRSDVVDTYVAKLAEWNKDRVFLSVD